VEFAAARIPGLSVNFYLRKVKVTLEIRNHDFEDKQNKGKCFRNSSESELNHETNCVIKIGSFLFWFKIKPNVDTALYSILKAITKND